MLPSRDLTSLALKLQQLAGAGLGDMPPQEFLELSEWPLPPGLTRQEAARVLVLRLTVQRQRYLLPEAQASIGHLEGHQADLTADDLFMFMCEATRVFVLLGDTERAIHYLLQALHAQGEADPDLRDYLHVVMAHVFVILWDDQSRLKVSQMVKRTPPPTHPYALNHNPQVTQVNLAWAEALTGNLSQALPLAQAALADIRAHFAGSGPHLQSEVNVLLLRAMLPEPPSEAEFDAVETEIEKSGALRLLGDLNLARAVTAVKNQDSQAAHQAFQKALGYVEELGDSSRLPLLVYDHALPFYEEFGDPQALMQVMRGRMRVVESMRHRVNTIFAELVEQTADLSRTRTELTHSRAELVDRLAAIGEARDDSTGQHTRRVGRLARELASVLNLDNATDLGDAARLHDLGKVTLPDSLLLKPGPLTPEERQEMQRHTLVGEAMLAGGKTEVLCLAREIARSHHERWDGGGYPDGLGGTAIPLPARIVAVADVFDALTSVRPYKGAWTVEEALLEIRTLAGRHFDPAVVAALEQVLGARTA